MVFIGTSRLWVAELTGVLRFWVWATGSESAWPNVHRPLVRLPCRLRGWRSQRTGSLPVLKEDPPAEHKGIRRPGLSTNKGKSKLSVACREGQGRYRRGFWGHNKPSLADKLSDTRPTFTSRAEFAESVAGMLDAVHLVGRLTSSMIFQNSVD